MKRISGPDEKEAWERIIKTPKDYRIMLERDTTYFIKRGDNQYTEMTNSVAFSVPYLLDAIGVEYDYE